MSGVTDEMFATAQAAAYKAWCTNHGHEGMIRAALAAVAPLIVRAEREWCARVAEDMPRPDNIYDWPDEIAAAGEPT